jgi:ABC-type Fe3+ transport system substrate-binding protein
MNWLRALGILLTILATACAPSAPAAAPTPTAAPAAASSDAAQWEKETFLAAQKEGKVVVYGFWNPTLEQMVVDFMAQRYPGVKLETLTSTTAAEKIRTEQQTSNYTADIYLGGGTTGYQLAQAGLTEAFKPPAETASGAKWVVAPSSYTSYPQVVYALQGKGILINTQLVPPDREPKSWTDLLDPFWTGKKIVIDHPGRGGGPGSSWARWSDEFPSLGRSFLEGLKNQDPVLSSGSATPQIEAVARGEYYAFIPAFPSQLVQVPGAPFKFIWPEPATGSAVTSLVVAIKNAPHPNATKLFLNMTLLPEFQQSISGSQWLSPNMLGVPLPDPIVGFEGHHVAVDTEADIVRTTDWANTIGRQIFGN